MRILFILFVLLAAVHIDAGSSIDSLKTKLDGAWEWVSTSGGIAGEMYTPQSTCYSLTLVFLKSEVQPNSDSIGYGVFRNDTLILRGIAAIQGSTIKMQEFGPNSRIIPSVEKVTDTLLMGTFVLDGFSSIFVRSKTPASSVVRGVVSDSATGAPIGGVKVVLMQMAGEIERFIDSLRTGANGGYSFTVSATSLSGLYIYTISNHHYYRSMAIDSVGMGDTITRNIKLKKLPTAVSAPPRFEATQGITVHASRSGLRLCGLKAGAVVELCGVNGRLLLRTAVPTGISEMRIPRGIAATDRCRVFMRVNGRPIF
jgi:5-hydroxyisourate hydrolase-like protein (transthyretin family)